MPRKKFIDRKNATKFVLVDRSHQDKYLGDTEASQHVLKDVSRKKEQQKYGVFYDDDYDYLQHLRPRFSAMAEDADDALTDNPERRDVPEDSCGEAVEKEEAVEDEDDGEEYFDCEDEPSGDARRAVEAAEALQFRIPEELLGFDEPMFEGRVVEDEAELDEDLLEAMQRAEQGGDGEDEELPDNFIHLASMGPPLEDYEEYKEPFHFGHFDGDEEDDEDEEDDFEDHKQLFAACADRSSDYYTQCMALQIEKLVDDAVTYDVEEVRSRLSGLSRVSESVRQAIDTDRRHAERLAQPPDAEADERLELKARTLAAIASEDEDENEDDVEDPVQAWVDFDRRPRVTGTVDAPRDGDLAADDAPVGTVLHPASVPIPGPAPRHRDRHRQRQETEEEEVNSEETLPVPGRRKGETAEERRERKAAVKAAQRQRRATKKATTAAFKAEAARQTSRHTGGPDRAVTLAL